MFSAGIIVFRESLEAFLVISIMVAATRGIDRRGNWIAGGVFLGLLGSAAVAMGMERISSLADGMGQELFNVAILLIAVGMLAWHNIWMAAHGRELARQMKSTARSVAEGGSERSVILVVIALAVLREGSETVLFLYGVATGSENGLRDTVAGGGLGLGAAALIAGLMFWGLLRIPVSRFFSVTGVLVLLLAASMASQAARLLVQADFLPSLGAPIWDTSGVLAQTTTLGTILHGLIGYDTQPAGMQVLVYVLVLLTIASGMRWVSKRSAHNSTLKPATS
jgi:high-affinity iron transporter